MATAKLSPGPGSGTNMFQRLRLVLVALGIAGVLTATGYICSFARDDFLGIGIRVRTVSELMFIAGNFAVQTTLTVLQQLLAHWLLLLFILGVCIALAIHRHIQPARTLFHRVSELVIVVALGAVATANLFIVYLPLVELKDAMVNDLKTFTIMDAHGVIGCGTSKYWELIIDSRRPTKDFPDPISNAYSPCVKRHDAVAAKHELDAMYSYGLVFCCLGWWLVYFNRKAGDFGSLSTTALTSGLAVLALNTLFLPYMFGKVVQSTMMPKAQISSMQPDKTYAWEGPFFVISESDKVILAILLDKKEGKTTVVEIPRESVNRINISQTSDALLERIGVVAPADSSNAGPTEGKTQ
jgi:hypothetical protein